MYTYSRYTKVELSLVLKGAIGSYLSWKYVKVVVGLQVGLVVPVVEIPNK